MNQFLRLVSTRRRTFFLVVAGSVATWLGCGRDPSTGGGARPPASEEIPTSISVHAARLTSGFATGHLRRAREVGAFRIGEPMLARDQRSTAGRDS